MLDPNLSRLYDYTKHFIPMTGFTIPRYVALAQEIQEEILKGEYLAGSQLPTERELGEQFGVSKMTVRQGIGLLVQKGLLERRQGIGTFVLRISQAKANVAVLVGDSLSVESAHYYRALANRLEGGSNGRQWKLRCYDCLNRTMFPPSIHEGREEMILSDHRHEPFHGLIEIVPGERPIVPAELTEKIPRVLMQSTSPHSDVVADRSDFGRSAVTELAGLGCRKLLYFATVWKSHPIPESVDSMMDTARSLGLPPVAVHVEQVHTQGYEMEQQLFQHFLPIVHSWKRSGEGAPQGLIVNDDITLRSIMPALLKADIEIPRDLKIFCVGNEDVRFHYGFPITRYEISPKHIADHLLSVLERRMNGEARPIPPLCNTGRIVTIP